MEKTTGNLNQRILPSQITSQQKQPDSVKTSSTSPFPVPSVEPTDSNQQSGQYPVGTLNLPPGSPVVTAGSQVLQTSKSMDYAVEMAGHPVREAYTHSPDHLAEAELVMKVCRALVEDSCVTWNAVEASSKAQDPKTRFQILINQLEITISQVDTSARWRPPEDVVKYFGRQLGSHYVKLAGLMEQGSHASYSMSAVADVLRVKAKGLGVEPLPVSTHEFGNVRLKEEKKSKECLIQ